MRKVELSMITPDMRLGKPIYHYNQLLLSAGIHDIDKYIERLQKLGITHVYVEDQISEEIVITDAVSDSTRIRCKNALQDSINRFHTHGSFDMLRISEATSLLIDEIFSRPDVLISLHDIGTADDSTLVHSINTTVFSLLIAQQLNLSKLQCKILAEGTILHDIGKTLVNPLILYKNNRLTPDEFEIVKQHTLLGYDLLKKNPLLSELSRIISLQHHERLDGSGYPYGLKSDKIHLFSKIVAIADMYDALTAKRCYRNGLSNFEAYKIITQDSAAKLDSAILAKFLKTIAIYPNGSIVNLSDGSKGIVKSQNLGIPFSPNIIVINENTPNVEKAYELDLSKTLNITIVQN